MLRNHSAKKLLSIAVVLAAFTDGATAQNSSTVLNEDNLLILDVRYENYKLGSGLEGYRVGDKTYFALVDVVALLEMPITVTSDNAKGEINEDDSFELQRSGNEWLVEYGKQEKTHSSLDITVYDELIFVEADVLQQWFPIELSVKTSDSILKLATRGSLPFQDSIARRERVFSSDAPLTEYANPLADIPYDAWDIPSADVRVTHITSRNKNNGDETNRSTFYTLSSNGDLGYMSSNIFVNGTRDEGINNVSMRFDRYDTERDLLGPLKLSQISFGDINAPGAISTSGRGLLLSNESNTSQFSRDFTTIEGNHYPGWEVELFLGDSVVDYQVVGDDGRYYFDDVILSQGNNDYRLVFYGPAGEKEVESRNLYVGEDSEDIRRLRYTFSVNQPNTRLYSDAEQSSTWQSNLVTRFAVTNFLSLDAAYSIRQWDDRDLSDERVLADDRSDQFYSAGVTAHLLGQSLSVRMNQVNDNAADITYGLGGGKQAFNYRVNYTKYGESETGLTYDPLNGNYFATPQSQLNTVIRSRFLGLSGVLDARRQQYQDYQLDSGKLIVSGRGSGFYWSKGFEYQQAWNNDVIEDTLVGDFFAGSSLGPLSARMNLTYLAKPEAELATIGVSSDLRLSSNVDVSFDYDHSVMTEINTFRLGMKWVLPYLTVTPYFSYSDNGVVSGNLTMNLSMGNRTGQLGNYYAAESRTISSRGTLKARLFEDENGDGRYTLGERLLSGGVIHSLQTRQKAQSDDVGIATISNVRAWFPSDIVYESDTVEEFSMKYGGEKFAVEMRPGKVIEVDLPFYKAGDIDGTVYSRRSDGRVRVARGITVELVDGKGEVIAKTVSSSDGFYSFQRVLPGKYRVIPKGQQTLSSTVSEAVITSEGNFIGGYDMVILEEIGGSKSASVVAPNGTQSVAQNSVAQPVLGERSINP